MIDGISTIHFGLSIDDLAEVPEVWGATVDGDGWNAWGDKPGVDVNDADTLHLSITRHNEAIDGTVRTVIARLADKLVQMGGYDSQAGIVLVVTDSADWSEQKKSLKKGEPWIGASKAFVAA
ncbi:hypothetical protein [Leifsonia sp. Leaf264]|uniref:hypothetical protein n=1 Tax=Leifsonia sp. Leaf264 TaxID=1736314 RepID=UPI0007002916|nr:hypothetical protein [Leifsonia sp. Leaf264]KQO98268.1 hypothetical protein ASF30_09410 [Leifsonia sp. Leaf264]